MSWRRSWVDRRLRVGWVAASTLGAARPTFRGLPANVGMRIASTARWIDRHARDVRNEMYRRDARYDVVVFAKAMDAAAQAEARRAQSQGAKVLFDANVNYYELWGDYDLPGTRPTAQQRADALAMTRLADWVVTDSSYLLDVARRVTDRASWIPDNVDTRRFRPPRRRRGDGPLRLVWSGMAHKARALLTIRDVLAELPGVELVVVSNARPPEVDALAGALPVAYVPFGLRRYARLLRRCHVIVSPKRLQNGYEMGHSEWKITLGMAAGLPAVASPQRSYVEAIEDRGGGIVAASPEEWGDALRRLREPELRARLGRQARETVTARYSTPVVARQYLDLIRSLA